PLRESAQTYGLSRSGPWRALKRGIDPASWNYESRQRRPARAAVRSGMVVSNYPQGRAMEVDAHGRCTSRGQRYFLEGAAAAQQPISQAGRAGKEEQRSRHRGRTRVGRLYVGSRAPVRTCAGSSARLIAGQLPPSAEDGETGRGEGSLGKELGRAPCPMSVARTRQPSDAPSPWGSQSPDKSLSDRRVSPSSRPLPIAMPVRLYPIASD